jgi:hypothetical protein
MPDDPRRSDPVVQLEPSAGEVAWSEAVLAQSLEILFVSMADDGPHLLRPVDGGSLLLGWSPSRHPGDLVLEAADRYGLTPLVVHSTSWRYDDGRLILTYVAVVERAGELSDDLVEEPIARTELARGDALRPPTEIATGQVVEHALRHLSLLVRDDPAIGAALARWRTLLDGYAPEAFRAFGIS